MQWNKSALERPRPAWLCGQSVTQCEERGVWVRWSSNETVVIWISQGSFGHLGET